MSVYMIDKDAVLDILQDLRENDPFPEYRTAIREIERMPSVEAEPVVHAHWIPDEGCGSAYGVLVISSCSNCGNQVSHHGYVCPDERCKFCGAHMDEEVADGDIPV